MAGFEQFADLRSHGSSERGSESLADSADRELRGLSDALDQEMDTELIEPDYETHQFRPLPEEIHFPEPTPGLSSSLEGFGGLGSGSGDMDMGMPIYATVNKNRPRPRPAPDAVPSTSHQPGMPYIGVDEVDADEDQRSEDALSDRSNKGVSFTADTVDNEGTSKRYRKERAQGSDSHRGRSSSRDSVGSENPIYETVQVNQAPNNVHINGGFTSRTLPLSGTVHSIPTGGDGTAISYHYTGGEKNQPKTQAYSTLPQPVQSASKHHQYVPHTVERVGLPLRAAPTVDWSPMANNKDFIILTDDNVSVITINSSHNDFSSYSPTPNPVVVNPAVASPQPPQQGTWPPSKTNGTTTFAEEGRSQDTLVKKVRREQGDSRFYVRLAIFFVIFLLLLGTGAAVAIYFFYYDD